MSQLHLAEANRMRDTVLNDPQYIMNAAAPLLLELGVDASYTNEPDLYIAQVRQTDPRYRNSAGDSRAISRQDVALRAHTMTDDMLVAPVMYTAEGIGITTPAYPFDEFAFSADAVLVTGGVLSALRERTAFALESGIYVQLVGSDRPVQEAELKQLEQEGRDSSAFKTEVDLSRLVANELEVNTFEPRTTNPDNLDVIREFMLTNPRVGKLAVVTTALYVPFTTTDAGAANAELGNVLDVRVYAGESDPAKVQARKVDIYRSEIARTVAGAARWKQQLTRRNLR